MDFSLLMFVLLLLTGMVWLLDIVLLRRHRAPERPEPWPVEYAKSFFPVILVVFVIRSFVVEPFKIPSGSMIPTLLVGDFLLVNKFTYGLRLPIVNQKITQGSPLQRGDVVVFRYPEDPGKDYIKRVVGLPGDTVAYINKQIVVNGQPVPMQYMGDYSYVTEQGYILDTQKYQESLGHHVHDVLIVPNSGMSEMDPMTVPAGQYFMMGDNRDNSNDSRYWGFVPDDKIVGKAMLIWWSWDGQRNRVRWDRMGEWIP
ncbi:MAG: signal peptidase I [Pseudomonadota bacterium]